MLPIMPQEWQGDVTRTVDYQGQQTQWFRTPDFAACCAYLRLSGECADQSDEYLQPAMMKRFFNDVKADVERVRSWQKMPLEKSSNADVHPAIPTNETGPKTRDEVRDLRTNAVRGSPPAGPCLA